MKTTTRISFKREMARSPLLMDHNTIVAADLPRPKGWVVDFFFTSVRFVNEISFQTCRLGSTFYAKFEIQKSMKKPFYCNAERLLVQIS